MKRWLCMLAGLMLLVSAQAQIHRRVPAYSFIRADRNRIQTPSGTSPDFSLFLRKLDSAAFLGYGDVRIVHVGGSHVQGGAWTQQLRRNLLSIRYGLDGGRGLVFPFAAAATNTPSGYISRCTGEWRYSRCLKPDPSMPLGVTGMAVETSDTAATIMIDLVEQSSREWAPGFTFRSVDIFGTGSARPVIFMDRDTLEGVFSDGRYHFDLPHYAEYLRVGFRDLGSFSLSGIYLDRPQHGLTLSEAGVNGASTGSFLNCENFERDMAFLRPDLVIFSIGINDIQGANFSADRFIRNYSSLVDAVRSASPHCAILFTTCTDSYRHHSPNRQGEEARMAFARLAVSYDAALWDVFDIMGGLGSIESWEAAGLARGDRVHFTGAGYDLLGDLLFNAIVDAWKEEVRRK